MKNGFFYELSLRVAPCLPWSVWGSSFANGKREGTIRSPPFFSFSTTNRSFLPTSLEWNCSGGIAPD